MKHIHLTLLISFSIICSCNFNTPKNNNHDNTEKITTNDKTTQPKKKEVSYKENFTYNNALGEDIGTPYLTDQIIEMYEIVLERSGNPYLEDNEVTLELYGQKYGMDYHELAHIAYHYSQGAESYLSMKYDVPFNGESYTDTYQHIMGVNLFNEEKQLSLGANFNFINPEAVRWMRQNILVKPNNYIGSKTFQTLFDKVAARHFKVMIASFYYIISQDIDLHAKEYILAAQEEDGAMYLLNKYHFVAHEYYEKGLSVEYLNPSIGIGFWLRRYVDGSFKELAIAYLDVINTYAPQWHTEIQKQYTNCNIKAVLDKSEQINDLHNELYYSDAYDIEGLN